MTGHFWKRGLLVYICLALLAFLFGPAAMAQDFRATITGRVSDSSGAVIPDAAVQATRVDTGTTVSTKTNRQGIYTIPFLLPGVYRVEVSAKGFRKLVRTNITLQVADKLNLPVVLTLGEMSQQVTVTAPQQVIETASASGGQVFDPTKTQNLPLNGRQVYMLLQLSTGVQFLQTEFGSHGYSGTRGWDVNNNLTMNGGWTGNNQFLLNGAPISTNGTWQVAPNVDAVQEFKVMTNTYDAQYGRTGGGTVNTVIKSGTNDLHGTLFDYIRNSVLDANTSQNKLVGAPRGKHITNQFGMTLGGPILKNRTFYYLSYEGFRERVPFPALSSTIPDYLRPRADGSVDLSSLAQKYGMHIYDPATTHCVQQNAQGQCSQYQRDPFPGDVIPANRISPIGLAVLNLYPLPNAPGCSASATIDTCPDTNNFFAPNLTGRYLYNQYMGRIDHTLDPADQIYTMVTFQRGHEFRNQNGFGSPAIRGNIQSERDDANVIFDATHTFSPTMLADLHLSMGRFHDDFPDGDLNSGFTASKLGLTMPAIPTTTLRLAPEMNIDRFTGIIGNNFSDHYTTQWDISPSLSQTIGRHTLHYGMEWSDIQYASDGVGRPNGSFSFGTDFTQQDPLHRKNSDGSGLADLLLGYPTGGNVDWNNTMFETYHYWAGYVQDDFHVSSHFSLNLGMRWDLQQSIQERYNRINGGFCYSCVNPINSQVDRTKFPNLPDPLKGGMQFAGVNGIPRGPYNNYYDQWQPRFGFSWQMLPHTVLRGGFGLYYSFADQHDTTTGFNQSTDYITSLDGRLTPTNYFQSGTPYPNGVLQPTGSSLGLATNLGHGVNYDSRTRRVPRTEEYSFGLQHELPGHILLDTEYVGSFTDRMTVGTQWDTITNAEQAAGEGDPAVLNTRVPNPFYGILPASANLGSSPTLAAWQLMRPYPEFDGVYEYTNPQAKATYNSLQVKAEKKVFDNKPGTGMTFILSYTWSKEFERNHYLNNGAFRDDQLVRELAYFDRTHVMTFSGVWNLPFGQNGWIASNASGITGALLNHWAFDWILSAGSGTPTGLPNSVFSCDSYKISNPTQAHWFNNDTSCYSDYPQWSRRTTIDRFNWIRNPYPAQLNVAVQKQFAVTERTKLQARIEAFNALNTPMYYGPDTNFHDKPSYNAAGGYWSGFGTIGPSQQNFPRLIQISLKVLF